MITKVWNHGRLVYQSAEVDDDVPNEAVLVHIDNGGSLCLEQAGSVIVLNRGTLKDLTAAIKETLAAHDKAAKEK